MIRRRRLPVRTAAPACWAPHTSMYFDQFGLVRACCQAESVAMGRVGTEPLEAIWRSASAEAIRTALDAHDYSQGCDLCAWQVREGNDAAVFARTFDDLDPGADRVAWPRQLEFALTNACNLQCVMCDGNFSSAIRAHREGRPPLPPAYDDGFFDELAPFLERVERVKFYGGEPFLGAEPLRVMELLAELDDPPEVHITTNATICTPRVERLVAALRPMLVVSLDGITPGTYDAIRVGASLPSVLANLDRFIELLGVGRVSLAHCLMVENWHELPELLAFAEARDLSIGTNIVRFPAERSLYELPASELGRVVATLAATEVDLTGDRRTAWDTQLEALANRLAVLERAPDPASVRIAGVLAHTEAGPDLGDGPLSRWAWLPFPEQAVPGRHDAPPPITGARASFRVGTDGVLRALGGAGPDLVELDGLDGQPVERLHQALVPGYGPSTTWTGGDRPRPHPDRLVLDLHPADGARAPLALVATAERDPGGELVAGRLDVVLREGPR